MKNNILLFLGIFAIVFVVFVASVSALTNSMKLEIRTDETSLSKKLGDNYDKFMENNGIQAEISGKVHSIIKSYYGELYPSYLGGVYISNDSLNLIIQIVEKNIPKETSEEYYVYNEIINLHKNIKIKYVKYSYNELKDVSTTITNHVSNGVYKKYSSHYIDVINNRIIVELSENNARQQAGFKNTVFGSIIELNSKINNSEFIIFDEASYEFSASELKPGGWVAVDTGYTCSMGPRVKHNGKKGYLTAGHCFMNSALGKTTTTGTLRVKQFVNNQKYDYAFVETNSSWNLTNKLMHSRAGYTTLAVVNYCPFITVNMAIGKSGDASHFSDGLVAAIGVPLCDSSNFCVTNMVRTSTKSVLGDSGGPVFTMRTDANGGPVVLGILSGGNSTTMFFSDLSYLPIALQNRY